MTGPVSPLAAARVLGELSGWTLSNLELQKQLYLAHMMYMGENGGQLLVNGNFEAWDYGPVSPPLYAAASAYGSSPVKRLTSLFMGGEPDQNRKNIIEKVYNQLVGKTASQLVAVTHWKDGAWAEYYRPKQRGIVIPNSAILEEYRKRVAAAAQRRTIAAKAAAAAIVSPVAVGA